MKVKIFVSYQTIKYVFSLETYKGKVTKCTGVKTEISKLQWKLEIAFIYLLIEQIRIKMNFFDHALNKNLK